ncbi:hypothetical protein, partial [Agromyces sp. ZXT2-3]|uniref:hypothetical protein n=1 Tax=Agromyces sp. ZXT2-3 TaxID=3461152 RepID=UPI004054F50C
MPRTDGEFRRTVRGLPRGALAVGRTLRRTAGDATAGAVLARPAGPTRATLVMARSIVACAVPALAVAPGRVPPLAATIVTRTGRTLTPTIIARAVLPLAAAIVTRTGRTLTATVITR